jgi:hypothetical protein
MQERGYIAFNDGSKRNKAVREAREIVDDLSVLSLDKLRAPYTLS